MSMRKLGQSKPPEQQGRGQTCWVSNSSVDANKPTSAVQKNSPRVSRIDSSICLNDIPEATAASEGSNTAQLGITAGNASSFQIS